MHVNNDRGNRIYFGKQGRATIMTNAFVRKLAGFAALDDREIRLLSSAGGASRKVAAYRDLIREGDRPAGVHIVLEGCLCRYKVLPDGNRQITAFMVPGDFCDPFTGDLEQIDQSIGTLAASEIVLAGSSDMEVLASATPGLSRAFRRAQLVEQNVLRAWVVNIGRRDALGRLANLLLELLFRLRAIGLATDDSCQIPLTQTCLADALGLTAVHVNRTLRVLKERDVLTFIAGDLVIHDMRAAIKISGFSDEYLGTGYGEERRDLHRDQGI